MEKFMTQLKVSSEFDIKRVLSASAKTVVHSKDISNGMLCVGGKLAVKIVYVSNENNVESAEANTDFLEKQPVAYALEDLFVSDAPVVVNVNFSGKDAICSVEHHVAVSGTYSYDIACNFDDENLVVNKKNFSCLKLFKTAEDSFVVAEEVESNMGEVSVLDVQAKAMAVEVNSSVDKAVIEGNVLVNLVLKDSDGVAFKQRDFEFKQEVTLAGASPNMVSKVDIEVVNVTVTPEQKNEKTNFVFAIDLLAKVQAYEETSYDIVTDMFSLTNLIATTTDYVEMKSYAETKLVSESVLSSTNVADIDQFDDVIGVIKPSFECETIDCDKENVSISGTVNAVALYQAGGEIFEREIKCPCNLSLQGQSGLVATNVSSRVEIGSFKVKAGKELETSFKIDAIVEFEKVISERYVASYENKAIRQGNNGGVTVYVAGGGDTLFDVAKAICVKPEIIAEQNECDAVFEQGDKIYVYSPINLI